MIKCVKLRVQALLGSPLPQDWGGGWDQEERRSKVGKSLGCPVWTVLLYMTLFLSVTLESTS